MTRFDDAPEQHWHCYFGKEKESQSSYARLCDLSKHELVRDVLTPWHERRPFNVGGKVIRDRDAMTAAKVVHTTKPSKHYEDALSRRLAGSNILSLAGIGFAAFGDSEGTDFTNELLFAPRATTPATLGSVAQEALHLGPKPRVVSLLGSGAEADVYLVVDRFNREVAAKVFYESKRVPEHIYGHAVGLARVPHPAVAELYTIDEVILDGKPVPAILMERLVGEELELRLRREVSIRELIEWGRTLLDVFAAMHAVDHFHPDPHPGNFFVTDQGLRLYDVLRSLSAENRSTGTKDSMRSNNARRVREIIEAMFDKLPVSDAVQTASRAFTSATRNANVTLEEIRRAFGDTIDALVAQDRVVD